MNGPRGGRRDDVPTPSTAAFEEAAREAAHRAGEVLRRRFRRPSELQVESKGWHDFVTDVDREAEDAAAGYLRGLYPDHEIMAEEGSPEAVSRGYCWILDPLDGTTNFIHGVPTFAVSVALEDPSGLAAAAIFDPVHDETFVAGRGRGARLNGEPVRCSEARRLEGTLIATGIPFQDLSVLPRYLAAFEGFVRSGARPRRAGAASLDLAFTACGRYDGFWEIGLRAWDLAAGALLIREAGGVVTDVTGGDDFLERGEILGAASGVHAAALGITRAAFA